MVEESRPLTQLSGLEIFTLVVLIYFVISFWTDTLHATVKTVFFDGQSPNPLGMALLSVLLTTILFGATQYMDIDLTKYIGGGSDAQKTA